MHEKGQRKVDRTVLLVGVWAQSTSRDYIRDEENSVVRLKKI